MRRLQHRAAVSFIAIVAGLLAGASTAAAQLAYHGGEVANNPTVYLTFWGKNWNQYPGARTEIREMFAHLSGSGWQGILTQYYDTTGPISPNVGLSSWTDESIAAPNAVNNEHAQDEIEYSLAQRGWPGAGVNNIYMVLPAPGSKYAYVEGCGVHHWSSRLNAPYAIVGWPEAGPMVGCANKDPSGQKRAYVGASMTASHEYAEAVVDPLGADTGWGEIADLCDELYGAQLPSGGWVEAIWDNSKAACAFSGPTPVWHYDNLGGGTILGDPAITSTGPGHLNVFVRGLDGNLWQKWTTDGGATWSAFQNVSGVVGGPIASSPGAVAWNGSRFDVVARMPDGTPGHWWWDGSSWHFENLGGQILGDPEIASTGPGHLNVFVRGLDGNLWQKWTIDGVNWSGWQMVGGPIASSPGATSALPNSLTVVARQPDSTVGVWSWVNNAWNYQGLSGQILGDPDISSTGSGAVNIFAEGLDERLWQKWTTGVGWSPWEPLSGAMTLGSGPSAVSWGPNRIDVVVRMPDGTIGRWWWG